MVTVLFRDTVSVADIGPMYRRFSLVGEDVEDFIAYLRMS